MVFFFFFGFISDGRVFFCLGCVYFWSLSVIFPAISDKFPTFSETFPLPSYPVMLYTLSQRVSVLLPWHGTPDTVDTSFRLRSGRSLRSPLVFPFLLRVASPGSANLSSSVLRPPLLVFSVSLLRYLFFFILCCVFLYSRVAPTLYLTEYSKAAPLLSSLCRWAYFHCDLYRSTSFFFVTNLPSMTSLFFCDFFPFFF